MIREESGSRVDLVAGESNGGLIAQYLAAFHPGSFGHVALDWSARAWPMPLSGLLVVLGWSAAAIVVIALAFRWEPVRLRPPAGWPLAWLAQPLAAPAVTSCLPSTLEHLQRRPPGWA